MEWHFASHYKSAHTAEFIALADILYMTSEVIIESVIHIALASHASFPLKSYPSTMPYLRLSVFYILWLQANIYLFRLEKYMLLDIWYYDFIGEINAEY